MFVASPAQLSHVLSRAGQRSPGGRLLDIGAGRGAVTHALATALGIAKPQHVLALESSWVLRRELQHRWGFRTGASLASLGSEHVDTVSLFNVLDRVDDPEGLLRAAVACLRPSDQGGGLLVLATVLPFRGLVQLPYDRRRPPEKPLQLRGDTARQGSQALFEQRATAFVEAVVRITRESGLRAVKLRAWSRLPYLSSADVGRSHYVLDNALFVFSTAVPTTPAMTPSAHPSAAVRPLDSEGPSGLARRTSHTGHPRHRPHHPRRRLSLLLDWLSARATSDAAGARNASGQTSRAASRTSTAGGGRGGSACDEPDAIFKWISATLQREGLASWGQVLDAGTGKSSLCWIVRHRHAHIDAVTAAASGIYSQQVAQRVALSAEQHARVHVVLGNWKDEALLRGRQYDVVVADFLIGAVESFWPYGQDAVFARLTQLVRPNGYLLFVGLEPYELLLDPSDPVRRIEALGDAAALLAGSGSSYREMPQAWVRRQLARSPGFRIVASSEFSSNLGPSYARSQLSYASDQAEQLPNAQLRAAFLASASAMRAKEAPALRGRSRNYAIVAKREPVLS